MKKLLFMAFAIVVSCIIGSCTAETEEPSTAQSKKVNEAKLKIMEMAKDYGLNVRIDEDLLDKYANQINLDTLEKGFRALAKIKGTYQLEKPTSDGFIIQTKQKKKNERSKKTYRYTYEFGPDSFYGDFCHYTCYCGLSWAEDSATAKIEWSSAHASVENENGTLTSHYDVPTHVRNNNIIDIDGRIDVPVFFGSIVPGAFFVDWQKTITIRFEVYGDYGDTYTVTWDCEEDLYNQLMYKY